MWGFEHTILMDGVIGIMRVGRDGSVMRIGRDGSVMRIGRDGGNSKNLLILYCSRILNGCIIDGECMR